jgi:hypothetical protein
MSSQSTSKCKTTEAGVHYTALRLEMALKNSCSKSSDPVRPTPAFGFESFSETTVNQSVQGGIERSRSKVNARKSFDVLRQGVPMLRPFGEAAQNECYGTGIAAKPFKLINHGSQTSPCHGIPSRRLETVSPRFPGVLQSRRLGTPFCNTGLMSTPTAPSHAVIEVTRKRPSFKGLGNVGWRVFIDGVWVGEAPMGKTVRFSVAPGRHTVTIWSHRGASCSNDLALDIIAGTVRSLRCGSNPLPLGLSQLPAQINAIRSVFKDGGVAKGAFYLTEDPALLNQ